jgi:hypothetical protein
MRRSPVPLALLPASIMGARARCECSSGRARATCTVPSLSKEPSSTPLTELAGYLSACRTDTKYAPYARAGVSPTARRAGLEHGAPAWSRCARQQQGCPSFSMGRRPARCPENSTGRQSAAKPPARLGAYWRTEVCAQQSSASERIVRGFSPAALRTCATLTFFDIPHRIPALFVWRPIKMTLVP